MGNLVVAAVQQPNMITRRKLLKVGAMTSLAALPDNSNAAAAASAKGAGYKMPLESEPHERTLMQWPARASIYGSQKALDAARAGIARIAKAIAPHEPVAMLAGPEHAEKAARALNGGIEIWPIATDDLWCRDSGPTFVLSATGSLAVTEFNFNGWGNKQGHTSDGRIARGVAEKLRLTVFDSGVVGEGGGVEFDGEGTALAHESCWVNRNRNGQSKAEIERRLLEALGAEQMIWAPGVKGADITDYHIDALARFVKPGQVVIQLPDKPDHNDPWSVSAFETYAILKAARDARGRKLDIIVIPEPVNIRSRSPDFVSSYVNYYVCNGAVISAEFGDDRADAAAKSILERLYPGREVVSLNVDPICEAGGGIHSATQQQPKARI